MINPSPIDETARFLISEKLQDLENYLNADVIVYYGEIFDSVEVQMKKIVEDLQSEANPKTTCYIMLTTPGGSLNPVNRMVTILSISTQKSILLYLIMPIVQGLFFA